MSAPTEMELRRPEPDTWGWECSVKDCREPVPADVEDQPHCESCHVPVCEVHVVTRALVHLCPGCYGREKSAMLNISNEMHRWATIIRKRYNHVDFIGSSMAINNHLDPNDVQAACERWMKEIGEVL